MSRYQTIADRTVLTDAMWAQIENIQPGNGTDPDTAAADNRRLLEAVLWWRLSRYRNEPGKRREARQRSSTGIRTQIVHSHFL